MDVVPCRSCARGIVAIRFLRDQGLLSEDEFNTQENHQSYCKARDIPPQLNPRPEVPALSRGQVRQSNSVHLLYTVRFLTYGRLCHKMRLWFGKKPGEEG